LNGDGKPDLVALNAYAMNQGGAGGSGAGGSGSGGSGSGGSTGPNGAGSMSVFLSGASAGFTGPQNYLAGAALNALAIGDLNGDGKADVAVTNRQDLAVLFNSGDGTLLAPVSFATGTGPSGIAIGDLNGDGKADIAVANAGGAFSGPASAMDGDVAVFLSLGNETFVSANYPAGINPNSLAIGDLNGDGRADLAVASSGGVGVLLNNGNGTFTASVMYGAGTRPQSVAIADLNGDGKPDLALSNGNIHGASVLLNLGNGTFAAAVDYAYSDYVSAIVVGDLNGDGKPDLAAIDIGSAPCAVVAVWLNVGSGTFGAPFSLVVNPVPQYDNLSVGDLNGDGKLDLVVPGGDGVGVLLNAGH
jgi:hypothetical protein